MEITSELKETIKKRAKRVFSAIDAGKPMESIRQHKLRYASQNSLIYNWRPRCSGGGKTPQDFRETVKVRRDKKSRIYITIIKKTPDNPAKTGYVLSPTTGTVIERL